MAAPTAVKLGNPGLIVSPMGFGCMGITAFYGASMEDAAAVEMLKGVYDLGFRHFDTAELYRTEEKTNEEQLANFLKTVPRDSYTVATKFWPGIHKDTGIECVTEAVDGSLKRLGLDFIDLYYCHRMPDSVEACEEFMRSMKTIVASGKVKHVGLSEVGPANLRKCHAIHPVCCVQQEWSLLTRNLEETLLPTCKELGVGVVAYSPLARNLLTNPAEPPKDWRGAGCPRYSEENFKKNKELIGRITAMGEAKGKTPAQLSLGWLYKKAQQLGVAMIPIPGTTKLKNATDNIGALGVDFTAEEMGQLEELAALVAGDRYYADSMALVDSTLDPK